MERTSGRTLCWSHAHVGAGLVAVPRERHRRGQRERVRSGSVAIAASSFELIAGSEVVLDDHALQLESGFPGLGGQEGGRGQHGASVGAEVVDVVQGRPRRAGVEPGEHVDDERAVGPRPAPAVQHRLVPVLLAARLARRQPRGTGCVDGGLQSHPDRRGPHAGAVHRADEIGGDVHVGRAAAVGSGHETGPVAGAEPPGVRDFPRHHSREVGLEPFGACSQFRLADPQRSHRPRRPLHRTRGGRCGRGQVGLGQPCGHQARDGRHHDRGDRRRRRPAAPLPPRRLGHHVVGVEPQRRLVGDGGPHALAQQFRIHHALLLAPAPARSGAVLAIAARRLRRPRDAWLLTVPSEHLSAAATSAVGRSSQ
ncbi:hypothetical protein A8924_0138 [Saccharopolyspora erythraea NRRL 2338]|nr:hypothetical protein A8924_0138 [Saccharopolyspora erythraea NRRL 2338]